MAAGYESHQNAGIDRTANRLALVVRLKKVEQYVRRLAQCWSSVCRWSETLRYQAARMALSPPRLRWRYGLHVAGRRRRRHTPFATIVYHSSCWSGVNEF